MQEAVSLSVLQSLATTGTVPNFTRHLLPPAAANLAAADLERPPICSTPPQPKHLFYVADR